jgi:hypothetical protein
MHEPSNQDDGDDGDDGDDDDGDDDDGDDDAGDGGGGDTDGSACCCGGGTGGGAGNDADDAVFNTRLLPLLLSWLLPELLLVSVLELVLVLSLLLLLSILPLPFLMLLLWGLPLRLLPTPCLPSSIILSIRRTPRSSTNFSRPPSPQRRGACRNRYHITCKWVGTRREKEKR